MPTFLLLLGTFGLLLGAVAAVGAVRHGEAPVIKVAVCIWLVVITLSERMVRMVSTFDGVLFCLHLYRDARKIHHHISYRLNSILISLFISTVMANDSELSEQN